MDTVRLEVEDRVAVLTLDDPDRRNALTATMVDEIIATVDALEARDDVGALVVTGAPPAFCAGADLGNLAAADRDGLLSIYEELPAHRAHVRSPAVAAVNGVRGRRRRLNLALVL